jgi:phosphocarrier protein HPr
MNRANGIGADLDHAVADGCCRTVQICNQRGLHARAAAKFVKMAASFPADVVVSRSGQSVGGESIMGLMMLAAGPGCDIAIEASGERAEETLVALVALVERGFDEN